MKEVKTNFALFSNFYSFVWKVLPTKELEFSTMEPILMKPWTFHLQKRVPRGATRMCSAISGGGPAQVIVLLSKV